MIKEIQIPQNCPSCNSKLERVNSQLFCRNSNCSAQSTKKVEAFVKKIGIKGLGPSNISKLGFVQPIEIYKTSLETYIEVLGEKIGQKIFDEIENSRNTTFATFLSALSIPLIGDSASRKIAEVANKFEDFMDIEIFPIGQVATNNLLDWWEQNDDTVHALEQEFIFNNIITKQKGKVCITGKLQRFKNRNDAKKYLESFGYTVVNTVTSNLNFLIDEEGKSSSKRKKAESLGIPIVSINEITEGN